MKGIIALLLVMFVFIGGTAWVAQQWRLEATQYATMKKTEGDILRQQLESEGIKSRSEIEADFEKQGIAEATRIEAEADRIGRTNVAEAQVDRSKLENIQGIRMTQDVIVPLQGVAAASSEFHGRSLNENLPEEERRDSKIVYDLLIKARMMVIKERELMLGAMGKAMAVPANCPADRP